MTTSVLFGVASWLSAFGGHDTHGAGGRRSPTVGITTTGSTSPGRRPASSCGRGPPAPRRSSSGPPPNLLAAVRAATAKYRDVAAAVADGYRPDRRGDGLDLHFEHKGQQSDDGAVLDPARPEMLVYARAGGRAALLGVVFRMPRAGQRGPQVGGATTTWHAHNICVGLLPPGFGLVTPYGTCPFLTAQVTLARDDARLGRRSPPPARSPTRCPNPPPGRRSPGTDGRHHDLRPRLTSSHPRKPQAERRPQLGRCAWAATSVGSLILRWLPNGSGIVSRRAPQCDSPIGGTPSAGPKTPKSLAISSSW